jgi:hypothetical protein
MKDFIKHVIVEGTKRWGGFMVIGGHVSMTQTDWHWIFETSLCVSLDALLVLGLYLEWKESKINKDEHIRTRHKS